MLSVLNARNSNAWCEIDGRRPGSYHEGCNHTLLGWILATMDPDTFLTSLYVTVDEYCKAHPTPVRGRGRPASLTRSEVVTLALFGQWGRFATERDFYRYADRHLRPAFPRLPARSQLNRLIRAAYATIVAVGYHLAALLDAGAAPYEVLDATVAPVRNVKRRGGGWLPEYVTRGWSNRLG